MAFFVLQTNRGEFEAEFPDDYTDDERLAFQAGMIAGINIGLEIGAEGRSKYNVKVLGLQNDAPGTDR